MRTILSVEKMLLSFLRGFVNRMMKNKFNLGIGVKNKKGFQFC